MGAHGQGWGGSVCRTWCRTCCRRTRRARGTRRGRWPPAFAPWWRNGSAARPPRTAWAAGWCATRRSRTCPGTRPTACATAWTCRSPTGRTPSADGSSVAPSLFRSGSSLRRRRRPCRTRGRHATRRKWLETTTTTNERVTASNGPSWNLRGRWRATRSETTGGSALSVRPLSSACTTRNTTACQ